MRFDYVEDTNISTGTLFYVINEQSLIYLPWQENNFSLILGKTYCGLDISSRTGEIVQIAGLNPMQFWIQRSLSYPTSCCGHLYIRHTSDLLSGTGANYGSNWKTFYDSHKNCICMGNDVDVAGCTCIEFCKGLVAALKKHTLVSIWGRISIVEQISSAIR